MSELLRKQLLLGRELGPLLGYVHALGYQCKVGEVMRGPAQAEVNALGHDGREAAAQLVERAFPNLARCIRGAGNGIRNSNHVRGLAVDLMLFDGQGQYLDDSNAYRVLGEWWEKRGPEHAWGGRFADPDGGHFSIEHEGIR